MHKKPRNLFCLSLDTDCFGLCAAAAVRRIHKCCEITCTRTRTVNSTMVDELNSKSEYKVQNINYILHEKGGKTTFLVLEFNIYTDLSSFIYLRKRKLRDSLLNSHKENGFFFVCGYFGYCIWFVNFICVIHAHRWYTASHTTCNQIID